MTSVEDLRLLATLTQRWMVGVVVKKMFGEWFSLLIFTFDVKIGRGLLRSFLMNCHKSWSLMSRSCQSHLGEWLRNKSWEISSCHSSTYARINSCKKKGDPLLLRSLNGTCVRKVFGSCKDTLLATFVTSFCTFVQTWICLWILLRITHITYRW